jgi:hypothetical protein
MIYLKNRRFDDGIFLLEYYYSEPGKIGVLFRFRDSQNYYSFDLIPQVIIIILNKLKLSNIYFDMKINVYLFSN